MSEQDVQLVRWLGGSVGQFLDALFADADEEQREATQRVERRYAFVDLMMLAILADGALLDDELNVLDEVLIEAPELDMSLAEAKARIAFKAKQIDTPAKMKMAMRAAANRLGDPSDRALAYQLAAQLHQAGARLGQKRGGYRANLRHDEGLLNLFAETLEIAEDEREALEHAPLVKPS